MLWGRAAVITYPIIVHRVYLRNICYKCFMTMRFAYTLLMVIIIGPTYFYLRFSKVLIFLPTKYILLSVNYVLQVLPTKRGFF